MTQNFKTPETPQKFTLAEIRVTLNNPEGINIYKGYMRFTAILRFLLQFHACSKVEILVVSHVET